MLDPTARSALAEALCRVRALLAGETVDGLRMGAPGLSPAWLGDVELALLGALRAGLPPWLSDLPRFLDPATTAHRRYGRRGECCHRCGRGLYDQPLCAKPGSPYFWCELCW